MEDYQRTWISACLGVLAATMACWAPAGMPGAVAARFHQIAAMGATVEVAAPEDHRCGDSGTVSPELTNSNGSVVRREFEKDMDYRCVPVRVACLLYANHEAVKEISVMKRSGYAIIHTIDLHFEHR
ncbi:hypothetical protein [Nocardia carnea]|uniref:Uncharacterized protein n=1 Tax=Nocardia carnea TaxID=37328 RepID=A0ABW7TN84_9NOCA|nr:hypothetical protein [Nocardia carnea]